MTFATSARGVTSIVTSARAITATARKTSVAATNVSASLLNDTYHERDSGSTTAIQKRWGHTVRLIAIEDLPHGKAYTGDVVHVKAGYARNYLIPQKMALYATPQNFERLGVVDPDLLLKQQKRRQDGGDGDDGTTPNLAAAAAAAVTDPAAKKAEKLMKDADLLRKYLKNKVLKIWRNVDKSSSTGTALHPGYVTAYNVRQKLSKQLKIDLEGPTTNGVDRDGNPVPRKEFVHIYSDKPTPHGDYNDKELQTMMDEFDVTDGGNSNVDAADDDGGDAAIPPCTIKVRNLGEYVAKITLEGGHTVPLKFVVLPRSP